MAITERKKMLIWGKTAPELSTKYFETVCTGAVLDDGTPIRLYPIPFRYMDDASKFTKYQWITATIAKSDSDPRPETYRIDCESIETGEMILPDKKEWYAREQVMFQKKEWLFDSYEDLEREQRSSGRSIGVVTPKEILSVELKRRPAEEQVDFETKKEALRKTLQTDQKQLRIFEEDMPAEMRDLDFVENRIQVRWQSSSGKEHAMQILDWEVIELMRKVGDVKALARVRECLDLQTHATRFFLGNFRLYQNRFSIAGLWYPLRCDAGLFG